MNELWTGRRAVPLFAALMLCLSVASCEDEDGTLIGMEVLEETDALRGGTVITGHIGVVEMSGCTGSMIAPNVVLTAAHCFDGDGAKTSSSGTKSFQIFYHDPKVGRRQVFNGTATWKVYPSYDGTGKDGPGGSNSDIAVIVTPTPFENTDYHDYLRVYSDHGNDLETDLQVYGAGRYTYSGKTDDLLRTSWFEVESVEYNHIVLDNRKSVCLCKGDSGGPYIYTTSGIDTVAAVNSKVEMAGDEGEWCANNDAPHDDAFGCRANWTKLQWVEKAAGIKCPLFTGANKDYRRCFDIPFIEDAPREGTYELGDSVAIATAVLF